MSVDARALLDAAHGVRERAHAPYSGFAVGAALLAENGKIYLGCNIENGSYGATVCAERVALGAALADGARTFEALAVVGSPVGERASSPCFPCGICRQVLFELCDASMPVYLEGKDGVVTHTVGELLPYAFSLEERA